MLKIRDWAGTWETHETRKMVKLRWVSMPVDLSSSGYVELMSEPGGAEAFGVFCALVQVVANAPTRGEFARQDGRPLTARVIAPLVRVDLPRLREILPRLREIGWIEGSDEDFAQVLDLQHVEKSPGKPGESPACPGESPEMSGYRTGQDRTGQDTTRPYQTGEDSGSQARRAAPPPPAPEATPTTAISSRPFDGGQDKPTPKDLLTYWDAAYLRAFGVAYIRTAGAAEATQANKVIAAIAKAGGDWDRIPRAIDVALRDDWAKDKGLRVVLSQFSKFDLQAQGVGQKFDSTAWLRQQLEESERNHA